MRKILFRAKRIDNGEWVVGHPIIFNEEDVYLYPLTSYDGVKVAPSTLCQFTGIHDKNEERIWEGDIVRLPSGWHGDCYCAPTAIVVSWEADRESAGFYFGLSPDRTLSEMTRLGSIHDTTDSLNPERKI